MAIRSLLFLIALTAALTLPNAGRAASGDSLLFSDEAVPWQELGNDMVERPAPVTEVIEDAVFKSNRERKALIRQRNETGEDIEVPERRTIFGANPFLGRGAINPGIEIPTGAVWQPVTIIYGEFRSALQAFDDGNRDVSEWANRLDVFTNFYLTPTERILVGFGPLDREGDFFGYRFSNSAGEDGFETPINGNIRTLYFEGDFGELFPNLDPGDHGNLDYGFAVGRMPLNFQDGLLLNDTIDAIGISRASLFLFGSSATRLTALFGWNNIHRNNNIEDDDALLYGFSSAFDYDKVTIEADAFYVDGDDSTGGDGLYFGLGQTRRFGKWNSTARANASIALDDETPAIGSGVLLFHQLSRTADYNDDIMYLNTFWGIEDFSSVARDPAAGGPLGNTGILFAAVGLGEYGAALGNRSNNAVGAAVGYQHFFDQLKSSQVVVELGGRVGTDGVSRSGGALGARYQKGFAQHYIWVLDGFVAAYEESEFGYGVRSEIRIKF
ncbi:hypothetical protein BH23VER1_BH23VER1_30150 [soil metagenome]